MVPPSLLRILRIRAFNFMPVTLSCISYERFPASVVEMKKTTDAKLKNMQTFSQVRCILTFFDASFHMPTMSRSD